jgi:hypothetical protein
MLDQFQTLSTMAVASVLLLSLAILLPLVGLVYGSARGLPLAQLGGVMIAYWVLALLSLVAAGIAFGTGAAEGGMLLPVTATSIVVPLTLKIASQRTVEQVTKSVESTSSTPTKQLSSNCRPQLASADVGDARDSQIGNAGKWAWHFWIGNYYEWRLEYYIHADDSGASGTASAIGKVSSWYALKVRHRNAVAAAKGSIDCEGSADKCLSVARPESHSKRDLDFLAGVEVRSSESGGLSVMEVVCIAEVSGTQGLSGLSVGPSGVGASLQTPNTARAETRKSRSYSYRCVHTTPPV